MPPTRIIPDATHLRHLVASGHTHQEIADMVYRETGQRVTRGAVSSAISRAGLSTPTARYKEFLPWRVKIEHSKHYAARMLRLLGRRESGEPLHPDDAARLEAWLARIAEEKAVVAYVPETDEGFHYMDPPKGYRRPPSGAPVIARTLRLEDIRAGKVRW